MEGKRFIQTLTLKNFLSFGPEGQTIELEPLNVLIGPNASGKSNFIEAIGILRASHLSIQMALNEGGGVGEWLWKGPTSHRVAEIDCTVDFPHGPMPLRYRLSFGMTHEPVPRFELVDESVENEHPISNEREVEFFYRFQRGDPISNIRYAEDVPEEFAPSFKREIRREEHLRVFESILSQRIDPFHYPEVTYLATQFPAIRLYREWNFGTNAPTRMPQRTDVPADFLEESTRNLAIVLNNLEHLNGRKRLILDKLRLFWADAEDLTQKVIGGVMQLFVHETGIPEPIPANRLSDGTLRYLCLLAILCHPEPPPLICLEEPELGMHPDIIPGIAELLVEASQRTQLIVTTHSDILVSALTEVPESVIVCEHDGQGTQLRRLEKEPLQDWLKDYSLGEVWRMGEIGGNRW